MAGQLIKRSGKLYLVRRVKGKEEAAFICDAISRGKVSRADLEKSKSVILASSPESRLGIIAAGRSRKIIKNQE